MRRRKGVLVVIITRRLSVLLTIFAKSGNLINMDSRKTQQNIHVFVTKYPLGVSSYYLPLTRREEIDACRDPEVRQRKYYAFKLLELALNAVYSKLMRDVKFEKSASGKWGCDVCEFSISHCNDIVVVAVSDLPVGVDVELVDYERFDERLQQRIFCKNEQSLAWQMSSEQRARYANKLWTVKEAAFKRDGGIQFAPNQIDASLQRCESVTVADGDKKYFLSVALSANETVDYHSQRVNIDKL